MQPATVLHLPTTLTVLQELLSSPQLFTVTVESIEEQGLTKDEAVAVLALAKEHRSMRQSLIAYADETNKPFLEKQREIQLKMLEQSGTSGKQTMQLITQLKESLIDNASGTLGAFNRVLLIYTVAFVIGALLIVTAVVFAAMGKTVLAIAFGAIGLVDMMTYFFKLPASQIQESRSNLSQLQVVLLVWLKDFVNNDVLSAKLINVENPVIENYKLLADININNTTKLLRLIQELAEPKE